MLQRRLQGGLQIRLHLAGLGRIRHRRKTAIRPGYKLQITVDFARFELLTQGGLIRVFVGDQRKTSCRLLFRIGR